jgi:bifunctional DNase/RNase
MDRCLRPLLVLALLALPGCGRTDEPAGPTPVEVRVGGVAVDERSESPVVILEEVRGTRKLAIWIGFPEASAIASQLESVALPRPSTHDLAKRLIDGLEGTIVRVVVSDLAGGVYYARIVLDRGGRSVEVDARPSDAIALALRFEAPLFVSEPLFERALEEQGGSDGEQRI